MQLHMHVQVHSAGLPQTGVCDHALASGPMQWSSPMRAQQQWGTMQLLASAPNLFFQVVIFSSTFAQLDHCGASCRRHWWSACHAGVCGTAQRSMLFCTCSHPSPCMGCVLHFNANMAAVAAASLCNLCRICFHSVRALFTFCVMLPRAAGVSRGSCEAFPVSALGAAAAGQGGLCGR
jgi:hypothetical protein